MCKIQYCLTHECWAIDDGTIDECFLTSCPPPELDMSDAWVDSLPVPDEDELALMDKNAEELLLDLES